MVDLADLSRRPSLKRVEIGFAVEADGENDLINIAGTDVVLRPVDSTEKVAVRETRCRWLVAPRVRRLDATAAASVEIELDGERVQVPAGISVAAALLWLGSEPYRASALGGTPRAPYCMMGVCFECLAAIDGRANQRACQVTVAPGMRVRRQLATGGLADEA